jgi:hypothetical protein
LTDISLHDIARIVQAWSNHKCFKKPEDAKFGFLRWASVRLSMWVLCGGREGVKPSPSHPFLVKDIVESHKIKQERAKEKTHTLASINKRNQ